MSTRSSARNLFPSLDNPELTIRRRSCVDPTLLNNFEMATDENGDLLVPDLRTMEELCQPTLNVKLKDLPPYLEYEFLEGDDKLPVIIAKDLKDEEKTALIKVLKSHKQVLAWQLFEIKGINPEFCTHKILMEDDFLKLRELAEYINTPGWNRPAICYNEYDDEDYTIAITPDFPITDSLIMGDEHLDLDYTSKNDRFDTKSYLFESLLNCDTLMASYPKFDSLLEEFSGELAHTDLIPPGIDKVDYDPEEEVRLDERLLYDNSSPRPPGEFNYENSDAIIKSFSPSPISVEDSDPLMEEIDLFLASNGSIPRVLIVPTRTPKGIIFFQKIAS
nr:reverse transcriptase domain-containing protein [Tanacetum cinerariifolium]